MSEQLKQMAAVIRDETHPSANTARRIGLCFEAVIDEHDKMESRLPSTRIPPLSLDITLLDLMVTPDYAQPPMGAFYLVYRTRNNKKFIVGTLQMFSDSMHHVLTQIFVTHETLTDGKFLGSHDHFHIQQYTRSYGLSVEGMVPGNPDGVEEFPLHGWGEWRPMTALPSSYGNLGMDGLMSAEDKGKLDKLHQNWNGFKIKLL